MIPDELVTRLQYIEIYTRKAARHHWVADYRSPLRGRGFEFDQHKPYQQGDDYRQIANRASIQGASRLHYDLVRPGQRRR